MNSYYFTASTTCAQIRPTQIGRGQTAEELQIWSGFNAIVVCADTVDAAQKLFEENLLAQPPGEHPKETKIHEIMAAQLIGELLTENGAMPLDWPQIVRQTRADVESTPDEVLAQGNWLDEGSINNISGSNLSLEVFGQKLPEDIRSGLNWSADKQSFLLISVLSPPGPPGAPLEEQDAEEAGEPELTAGTSEETQYGRYMEGESYPKLTPMEAAVLVRARNSAVAVWLWRKYAEDTTLAQNQVRLEGWYGVLGVNVELPADGN